MLVKVQLQAKAAATDALLKSLEIGTTTNLNAKTQPKLNLGKNTVYVGAGEQTELIVFWPELQGGKYKQNIVEEKNITGVAKHIEYQGALHPTAAKEDAHIVYRVRLRRPISRGSSMAAGSTTVRPRATSTCTTRSTKAGPGRSRGR